MDREAMLEQLQPTNDSENLVFVPNEIFNDIAQNQEIIISKHKAFAYCYYCLISYLYRYAVYGAITKYKLNIVTLKKILGYGGKNEDVDYITKKKGVMDKIGYTKTTREIPISIRYYDSNDRLLNTVNNQLPYTSKDIDHIHFVLEKELEHVKRLGHEIKYPIKAFYRENDFTNLDGTFFYPDNCHSFDIRIFLHAMNHKEIGLIGFYVYQFIKHHKYNTIQIALQSLSKRTGIAETTLNEYLKWLEYYNYIFNSHEKYRINAPQDERKACTYIAKKFKSFLDQPNEEREIRKVEAYIDEETIQEYFDKVSKFEVVEYAGEEESWD